MAEFGPAPDAERRQGTKPGRRQALQAECAPCCVAATRAALADRLIHRPMSVHSAPADPTPASRPAVTLPRLREAAARGEKLTMLTCYDATFARVLEDAG